MRFELVIALDFGRALSVQEKRYIKNIEKCVEYVRHEIDEENIMYVDININSLEELISLPKNIGEEIVIQQATKTIYALNTMAELGLIKNTKYN